MPALRGLIDGDTRAGFEALNQALKARCEAGDAPGARAQATSE